MEVVQEAYEKCNLCKDFTIQRPTIMTQLPCGHSLHTECFLFFTYISTEYFNQNILLSLCPVCEQPNFSEERVNLLYRVEETRRTFSRDENIQKLWNENPGFREDIFKLSKLQRKSSAIITQYKKDRGVIKSHWQDEVKIYRNYINIKKKDIKQRLLRMPLRARARSKLSKILSLRREILRKYPGVLARQLSTMNRLVPGAPVIKHYGDFDLTYYFSTRFLLRVRI